MSIFSGLEKIVEKDYPLARRTWYGLGGPADYFIRPKTTEQLKEVVKRCNENEIRIYVMGFGSNLLIGDDGLRGAVIKLEAEQFAKIKYDGQEVTAGAGAELSKPNGDTRLGGRSCDDECGWKFRRLRRGSGIR
jgi:UDP-N-acetylmuramate dehydrogenase